MQPATVWMHCEIGVPICYFFSFWISALGLFCIRIVLDQEALSTLHILYNGRPLSAGDTLRHPRDAWSHKQYQTLYVLWFSLYVDIYDKP